MTRISRIADGMIGGSGKEIENSKHFLLPEENEAQEVRFTRKPPFVCQINWQKVEKFDFMRAR